MKAFGSVIFVLGVLCSLSLAAATPEATTELEKKVADECRESTQATDDDVKILLDHELPKTSTGKCLLACAQEKFGMIVDGKVSVDSFKLVGAKRYEGNEKAIATFNEIVDACQSVADSDKCELGFKLLKCVFSECEKRGIDPKKGIQTE